MKTIKELPEHDRPREKMRLKGAAGLTNEELVQVILGSGLQGYEVRTIAQQVTRVIEEKKGQLVESDLMEIGGIGPAKGHKFLAAFELARRFAEGDAVKITGAQNILALDVIQQIAVKQQEHFVCISLNGANEVIEKRIVTVGLLDRNQVHPREVFADVIADRAAAVIFAHNHPSGDLRPSDNDLRIHTHLTEAAKILGLRVLDHVIVSKKSHFSFQEQGLIQ